MRRDQHSRPQDQAAYGPREAAIHSVLQQLLSHLPAGIRLAGEAAGDHKQDLHEAELALIERASDTRVREFSTGRRLAHRILAQLIPEPTPILRGPHREPLWPGGIVGSISHSAGFCAVAVGLRESFDGIGLDLQVDYPDATLAELILSDDELASNHTVQNLRLKFSAKEAVFKCLFEKIGSSLGFRDLNIVPNSTDCTFATTSATRKPYSNLIGGGEGRYVENGDAVVTAFWMPAANG
jgi:4'-phosphopantetheinyl transferase EntD